MTVNVRGVVAAMERLTGLHEELEVLNTEAHELEERITQNITMLLEEVV